MGQNLKFDEKLHIHIQDTQQILSKVRFKEILNSQVFKDQRQSVGSNWKNDSSCIGKSQ